MIELEKQDFPPLWPGGFHAMTLEQIKSQCVDAFPGSTRRRILYERLVVYLTLLAQVGLPLEVWIDGSFVTEKAEPDDIDVAIIASAEEINVMSPEKLAELSAITETRAVKERYMIHAFLLLAENVDNLSYWRGWFGFQRDNRTAKGVALLEVRP